MTQFSRRDFLKVAGTTLAGMLTPDPLLSLRAADTSQPNIIIILWDACSAKHLSLYGYPRLTTPNIDVFAQTATVFHNHYSGSNFTTTGTASMLTGMLPWKHRAINYDGLVNQGLINNNPYTLLGPDYFRFAFSQNPWPDRLVGQYYRDVDRFLSPAAYSLFEGSNPTLLFENDRALASVAVNSFLMSIQGGNAPVGSPILGYLNKSRILNFSNDQRSPRYPKGIPEAMNMGYVIPYLNENIYDGIYSELSQLASGKNPYFAYFHLYSPHYPYRPRNEYLMYFREDGYRPVTKPIHPMSHGLKEGYLLGQMNLYDKQVAQIDEEFGNLIAQLDRSGILENSYLIFTSDHGELFERGFVGHGFQLLYEPVLHIPLVIRAPGQTKREDVFALTSNIDILPTILSVAGKDAAPELEGKPLPGFGGWTDEDRPIFSMVAVDNSAFAPIKKAAISMRKHAYKLIAYLGYEDKIPQSFELYDLENDPEELDNLAAKDVKLFSLMKTELLTHLQEANDEFEKRN
jgi:arylsulfatase A-like enzyme